MPERSSDRLGAIKSEIIIILGLSKGGKQIKSLRSALEKVNLFAQEDEITDCLREMKDKDLIREKRKNFYLGERGEDLMNFAITHMDEIVTQVAIEAYLNEPQSH